MRGMTWAALAGIAILAGPLRADTVFLKDGTEVRGDIVEEGNNAIVIKVYEDGMLRSIARVRIDVVVYERKSTRPMPAIVIGLGDEGTEAAPAREAGDEGEGGEAAEKPEGEEGEAAEKPEGEAGEGGEAAEKPEGEGEAAEGEAAKPKAGGKETAKGKKPDKGAKGKGEGEDEEVKINRPELDEEQLAKIKKFMEMLESDDEKVRGEAISGFQDMGKDTIGWLADGLYHPRVEGRAACAKLLGQFNASNTTKHLIEALFAALPDEGEAATYQVPFVRELKFALMAVTGQSFINVEPDKPLVQDGLKQYIAWYEENLDRLPPQIDEPLIEPLDPDYVKKIAEARKLSLKKHAWPRPPLSVEHALGEREEPEKPIERPQDLDFKEAFPKTDRETGGGYIREGDQKFAEDFFR